jgi:hypothetical protein
MKSIADKLSSVVRILTSHGPLSLCLLTMPTFSFLLLVTSLACSNGSTSRGTSDPSPEKAEPALLNQVESQLQTDETNTHSLTQFPSSTLATLDNSLQPPSTVFETDGSTATVSDVNLLSLLQGSATDEEILTQNGVTPSFDFSKPFYLRTPTCVLTAETTSSGTISTQFHCEEGFTNGAWFQVETSTGTGYISIQNPANAREYLRMYRPTGGCSSGPPQFGSTQPSGTDSVSVLLTSGYPFVLGQSTCSTSSTIKSYYRLTPTSLTFSADMPVSLVGTSPLYIANTTTPPVLAPILLPSDKNPKQIFLPFCYLSFAFNSPVLDCSGDRTKRATFTYTKNSVDQKFYLQSNGISISESGAAVANPVSTTLDAVPNALSSVRYIHVGSYYITAGNWSPGSLTIPLSMSTTSGFLFVGEEP